MMTVLGLIGTILTCAIGIWRYFHRKNKQRREAADAAFKLMQEGIDERDPSKITAGFNRINRL